MPEVVLEVRRAAGEEMEVGRTHLPLAVRAVQREHAVERGDGDGEVGLVQGDAVLRRADDRLQPVVALARGAAAAGIALVARRPEELAEVRTARPLHEVPADRRGVAQLRRRARQQRLRDGGEALLHERVRGDVGHAREGADTEAAGDVVDAGERQGVDVDDVRGALDVRLHQVDEVRPAGDEFGRSARAGAHGAGGRGLAHIIKWMHGWPRGWRRRC